MKPAWSREEFLHQPFYCEENTWKLLERINEPSARVVFVSNPTRSVAMLHQRAAPEGRLVAWDYHVWAALRVGPSWYVLDLDTRLPFPTELRAYLQACFPEGLPPMFLPRFRTVDAQRWVKGFWSDRSHMRAPDGTYRAPVPPWGPPLPEPATYRLADLLSLDPVAGASDWMALHDLPEGLEQP